MEAKAKAAKKDTADLGRTASTIRDESAQLKKASFVAKDKVASAHTKLKQTEVRTSAEHGGEGGVGMVIVEGVGEGGVRREGEGIEKSQKEFVVVGREGGRDGGCSS